MLHFRKKSKFIKGLSLLEIIVTIGMIILFFAVIASVAFSLRTYEENKFKIAASYILQSSVDKIRSLQFDSLTQRTNAPLTGITFNLGKWVIEKDSSSPSTPNSLRLKEHASQIGGATALITAPASNVEDGDFEAKIKLNSAPQDSFAGLFFRSQDNYSYYRFIFNNAQIKFEKVVNGAPTILYQQNRTFATSSYYKLKASFSSSTIILSVDDWELTTINDSAFKKGDLGIIVTGALLPSIDDVKVASGLAFNWNFDNSSPPELPITWKRYSLYDLPQGNGYLTIEDIGNNLKKIIVKIEWTTFLGKRQLEAQTIISK